MMRVEQERLRENCQCDGHGLLEADDSSPLFKLLLPDIYVNDRQEAVCSVNGMINPQVQAARRWTWIVLRRFGLSHRYRRAEA